ncbi:MAG: SIR2 family protein, partial [Acidobacteriota bacterium]
MNRLDDLKSRLAKGRVLVVVGAGVSIAATDGASVASWKGLLDHGIDRCCEFAGMQPDWAQRMRENLATGDVVSWLAVATEVEERLKGVAKGEFRSWLEDTVGQLTVSDPALIEALRDLGTPIATTNYDGLIEEVTGLPAVTWCDAPRVQRVLQGEEPGVIHLHGWVKEPESIVLGYRSYAQVLGDAAAQAMQQTLRTQNSLLYVGFGGSFEDPNFTRWLAWARETFTGRELYRHYRLCLDGEVDAIDTEHPGEDRIFALGYAAEYRDLAPFLEGLARSAPSDETASEGVSVTPVTGLPPTDWLFGRDAQLADLVDHLLTERPAPVPILGGPGMGKTVLSVHALKHPAVAERFGSRRYFVRCEAMSDAEALPGGIALAMGLAAPGDPWPAVQDALMGQPALLVLDNFETPWDADRIASERWLSELGDLESVALMVSVRGAQRPHGAKWYGTLEINRLAPEDGEKLFLEVVGRPHHGDAELKRLVEALDGVPLAIRLMARVASGYLSMNALLEAWDRKRAAMLSKGRGREDNLEVSVALSYDGPRMDDQSRELFSALGLLPSGLASIDLKALWPKYGQEAVGCLVSAGLAFYDDGRARLLNPIREAALRLAPASSDLDHRIAVHYLALARESGAILGAAGGGEAKVRLEPEIGNLTATFRRAFGGPAEDLAFAAAYGLAEVLRFTGLGSPKSLEEAAERAKELERTKDQANCIQSLGDIALDRSDHAQAGSRYEEALPLYRRVGDVLGEANCIKSLGDIALRRSDHAQAGSRYEEAL